MGRRIGISADYEHRAPRESGSIDFLREPFSGFILQFGTELILPSLACR